MKLLIAEDDSTTRTMLAAITNKWGYEPIAVEDGEAAWEILLVLLLDWGIPMHNGLKPQPIGSDSIAQLPV